MYELDYVYVHLIILGAGMGRCMGGGGSPLFGTPKLQKEGKENVVHKRTNASDLSSLVQLPRSTPNTL